MKNNRTNTLHIVGPKNSGKTTLTRFLVKSLTELGFEIGAFKHSSHDHPIDKPGSDSDQLREAGAQPVAFSTPTGTAVFFNDLKKNAFYELFDSLYKNCHLVLIESFRSAEGPKILIQHNASDPVDATNVIAVVNPEGFHQNLPAFAADDSKLIAFILNYFEIK